MESKNGELEWRVKMESKDRELGWRVRMKSKDASCRDGWDKTSGEGGEGLKRVEKKGVNDYPRTTLFKPSYKFTSSLL